jgi:energy-coupling factor transport system substrate-specific component
VKRWRTTIVLAVTSLIGVAAFLSPFWLARAQTTGADRTAHGGDAPLLFAVIGVLVAANAALRLIPGIFGASPIFFLPICVGFVWGPSFGFLLGAASIAVSGLLTGGIGPWLPFQMMTLGWVGLTAGLLPGRRVPPSPNPSLVRGRGELSPPSATQSLIALAIFAALWGFLFGAIMNLWFWPFAAPASPAESGLYWAPGLGVGETMRRYLVFYGATSAVYDAFRAAGNVAMFALFGRPVLLLLLRFRDRFTWQPVTALPTPEAHDTLIPDNPSAPVRP